ncbi:hypothetical protein KBA73_03905 [Patescibacteria group bacterium]|nr:hypothetical protein [Patescibacteria group bacterium]
MPLEGFSYEDPPEIIIPPYEDDGVERDPEARRLREACYKLTTDRLRPTSRERSFTDQLDEIEIYTALEEKGMRSPPVQLEKCAAIALAFHEMFQALDALPQTFEQEPLPADIRGLILESRRINLIIGRLPRLWHQAICDFIHELGRMGEKIRNGEETFGCTLYSLDMVAISIPEEHREWLLARYPMIAEIYKRFRIERYVALKERAQKIETALHERAHSDPQEVKTFAQDHFDSSEEVSEWAFDEFIGIQPQLIEGSHALHARYSHEQVFYQGTPYDLIRDFLKELHLTEDDVLYDLGSGYGRVPLYGAMTTKATFKGIEIIPERVAETNALKERFGLANVSFQEGNVLEQEYSDGTVFFLFNPFTRNTLEQVNKRLEGIAKTKKIRVVSVGPSTRFFKYEYWLEEVPSKINHPWGLSIFESQ